MMGRDLQDFMLEHSNNEILLLTNINRSIMILTSRVLCLRVPLSLFFLVDYLGHLQLYLRTQDMKEEAFISSVPWVIQLEGQSSQASVHKIKYSSIYLYFSLTPATFGLSAHCAQQTLLPKLFPLLIARIISTLPYSYISMIPLH